MRANKAFVSTSSAPLPLLFELPGLWITYGIPGRQLCPRKTPQTSVVRRSGDLLWGSVGINLGSVGPATSLSLDVIPVRDFPSWRVLIFWASFLSPCLTGSFPSLQVCVRGRLGFRGHSPSVGLRGDFEDNMRVRRYTGSETKVIYVVCGFVSSDMTSILSHQGCAPRSAGRKWWSPLCQERGRVVPAFPGSQQYKCQLFAFVCLSAVSNGSRHTVALIRNMHHE